MYSHNTKFDGINNYWLKIYDAYSESLEELSLSDSTKSWRLKHIRGFIRFLSERKIYCYQLKPAYVYEYLSSIENMSHRTREHRAICIRFFLNYLYFEKKLNFKGNDALQKIHCNKEQKIISNYSDKEIKLMINACKNKSYNDKLNYAILSLIIYYGLRRNDIINLKLESLDWSKNNINIIQSKTNSINVLPIIDEVKYPLLDYLKNGRKNLDNEFVFIKDNGNQIDEGYIYNMLNGIMKKANINIDNRKHGPHALRHSIASSMINTNESIYSISKVLGHSNLNDTKIYLKLDQKKLKKISLEVPKW